MNQPYPTYSFLRYQLDGLTQSAKINMYISVLYQYLRNHELGKLFQWLSSLSDSQLKEIDLCKTTNEISDSDNKKLHTHGFSMINTGHHICYEIYNSEDVPRYISYLYGRFYE